MESDHPVKMSSLLNIVEKEDIFLLKKKIEEGEDPNTEYNETTPFLKAVENGNYKIVEELLRAGGSLNKRDVNNLTPLLISTFKNYLDITRLLLEEGANVQEKGGGVNNIPECNSMYNACYNDDIEMVKLLLDYGFSLDKLRENDPDPIPLSIENCNYAILSLLVENGGNVLFNAEKSIILAVNQGCLYPLSLLLSEGIDPNTKTEDGSSLLHIACLNEDEDIVKILIESGGNVNSKMKDGTTPLLQGCLFSTDEVVDILLNAGANPNIKDNSNRTPLMEMVKKEERRKVESLLLFSANPNEEAYVENDVNSLPLIQAVVNEFYDAIELLIEMKADPYLESNGTNAVKEVIKMKDIDSLKLFLESAGLRDYDNILYEAVKSNDEKMLKALLFFNPDVNKIYKYGYNLLHLAVRNNNIDMVKLLLDNKVNVNIQDVFGNTPLHIALLYRLEKIIALLIPYYQEFDVKNKEKETPITLAIKNNYVVFLRRMLLSINVEEYSFDKINYIFEKIKSSDNRQIIYTVSSFFKDYYPYVHDGKDEELNLLFIETGVNIFDYFGEKLESMPTHFFIWFAKYLKKWEKICQTELVELNQVRFITQFLKVNSEMNVKEMCNSIKKYIEEYREKIEKIDISLCKEEEDPILYTLFKDNEKIQVFQYGDKIGEEKYRCISMDSLDSIFKEKGVETRDPLTNELLRNKTSHPMEINLLEDYLLRKMLI